MNVCVFTLQESFDNTQSLLNVVADHLKMLLGAGIRPKLLVHEYFNTEKAYGIFLDKRIDIRFFSNSINGKRIILHNYKLATKLHNTFNEEVEFIAHELLKKLNDIDVCFLHDIFYQGSYLIYNIAIRKVQRELPKTKFISITHSIPDFIPKGGTNWPFSEYFSSMPNTTYVSLSMAGISPVAKAYKIPPSEVYVLNNSLDFMDYMRPEVRDISFKFDFMNSDIFIIYPARLLRLKRLEDVAALAGAIKKTCNKKVKLLFCDPLSNEIWNEEEAIKYKKYIRVVGALFGLDDRDIAFTSELGYKRGLPRAAILDLFTLSNLFIFPSKTESFGLVLLEAASRGNFLVLNDNVAVFHEISSQVNAFMLNWEEAYGDHAFIPAHIKRASIFLGGKAEMIVKMMDRDNVLKAKTNVRRRYSLQWIWENQFKKLLLYL